PARLRYLARAGVVEGLVIAVALNASGGFLEKSHLLRGERTHVHRPPEGRSGQNVREGCMTGDADRLRLTRPELFAIREPDLHPLVQVSRGAFPIPADGRGPFI